MGATVRNPHVYESYLKAESGRRGKVVGFPTPKEHQLRMVDALAAQIRWRETDGYLRFCHKIIKAPRPRNSKEITTLRLALQSMIDQQLDRLPETSVESRVPSGISSDR